MPDQPVGGNNSGAAGRRDSLTPVSALSWLIVVVVAVLLAFSIKSLPVSLQNGEYGQELHKWGFHVATYVNSLAEFLRAREPAEPAGDAPAVTGLDEDGLGPDLQPSGEDLAASQTVKGLREPVSALDSSSDGNMGPPAVLAAQLSVPVLWMAPFVSGGGYSSEAISYASALYASGQVKYFQIAPHGDGTSWEFWNGLPEDTREMLSRLAGVTVDPSKSIVICHSEPGAWAPPLYQTQPCPPGKYEDTLYSIGRTMFETDRVNINHVERCNKMDAVWVPTDFHMATFAASGVLESKLVKIPQAVDVDFFDPAKARPSSLPKGHRIFGETPESETEIGFDSRHGARPRSEPTKDLAGHPMRNVPFVFLSIFKWEFRKGWDILLRAYLHEFSASDNVELRILTNPYHSKRDFGTRVEAFVENEGLAAPEAGFPPVLVLDTHVPQADLPGLYLTANAFVLPTRGEGWGRPVVEAMAMGLPVIATNWSGMTEYMTDENSFPLEMEGFSTVAEGPFQGHQWAEPSVEALKSLMRRVYRHPEESRTRGRRARADMVEKYSPGVVGRILLAELKRVEAIIAARVTGGVSLQ